MDELYDYKKRKSIVQEKRLKDCYKKLIEVSANIEGGLKNITDPATDFIKNYARKKGYPISDEFPTIESPSRSKSKLFKVILGILGAIIIGYITNLLFEWKVHQSIWNLIKSLIFGSNI
ncbi:MAG: hypothetical protein OIN86_12170 [Candidatus Methanoperedens sp.]|nr:hypothetical protein [Candidatus Methanoperedens sp.]CAG0958513.1 hypothetical protein METP1_00584 [Methanosarcinales archaeon]